MQQFEPKCCVGTLYVFFVEHVDNKRFLSVNDIESLFDDEEFFRDLESADSVDIAVLPPDPDILSDCDDGDDDGTGEYEVSDVPGNLEIQLQGPSKTDDGDDDGTGEYEVSDVPGNLEIQLQGPSKTLLRAEVQKKLTDIPFRNPMPSKRSINIWEVSIIMIGWWECMLLE
ncbi:hypothetical protein QE152_g34026 [Popillia japonica]|uniref:Uncharacterized protein n=1 Tax=Popillia japonica TaxID=7064 RepID=A0AAW1IUR0_POPJA